MINGGYLIPFVDRYSISNGTLWVSPAPGYDGMFPTGSAILLSVLPDLPGSQIFWEYVDWYGGGEAHVYLVGDHGVQIEIVPPPPTPPPPNAWSYYDKGQEYFDAGNWSMAIEQFTLALQVNPQWEDAYFYRGYAYDELGQYQRAIQDYNKAIEIDPNDATNYVVRAVTYRNLGQFTLADADTTTACSLDSQWC